MLGLIVVSCVAKESRTSCKSVMTGMTLRHMVMLTMCQWLERCAAHKCVDFSLSYL